MNKTSGKKRKNRNVSVEALPKQVPTDGHQQKNNDPGKVIYGPKIKKLDWPLTTDVLVVCYDLESAYGNYISEIFQIGFTGHLESDNGSCSVDMLPEGAIHFGVTKHAGTNVTVRKDSGRRQLFHVKKKTSIPSCSQTTGLTRIVKWLKDAKKSHGSEKLILLAHGDLDMPCLLNSLAHYHLLDDFAKVVDGFGNTMDYIGNNLGVAFERLAGNEFEAHNALADSNALFQVIMLKQATKSSAKGRLAFDENIRDMSMSMEDSLAVAKYKVTKLCKTPRAPDPANIVLIKALVMDKVPAKSKFVSQPTADLLHIGTGPLRLLAFDVQFQKSRGIRSEAVELALASVDDDESLEVAWKCIPSDERHLFRPGGEGWPLAKAVKDLVDVLKAEKAKAGASPLVLCSFTFDEKKWPALANHVAFFGLAEAFAGAVDGICNLSDAWLGSQRDNKSLEKLYAEFFPGRQRASLLRGSLATARAARAVLNEAVAKTGAETVAGVLSGNVVALPCALDRAKRRLDAALGEDIAAGFQLRAGDYASYQMALPASCS